MDDLIEQIAEGLEFDVILARPEGNRIPRR